MSMKPSWLAATLGFALALSAQAQPDYPSKPIRFITISAPGAGGDAIARLFAEKMAPILKTAIFVDNKPGAGGAIGADAGAKAAPDGYTILLGGFTSHVLLPAVRPKLTYDPPKDFDPVGQIGTASILLMAANDFPANNVKDLVALAKAQPDKLMYASWGIGSTGHFCGELLAQRAQVKWTHVPYKSMAPVINDIIGGQIKLALVDTATGAPLVKSGRAKALGMCVARSPALPEVRGFEEDGIDFAGKSVTQPMWAIYAPAGTPKPIVAKLSDALRQSLEMPDVKERMLGYGVKVEFAGTEPFRKLLADGIGQWREIAQKSNIVID
jgi:tripartite-type tricarboxylate transporter receptor subunit TctC